MKLAPALSEGCARTDWLESENLQTARLGATRVFCVAKFAEQQVELVLDIVYAFIMKKTILTISFVSRP